MWFYQNYPKTSQELDSCNSGKAFSKFFWEKCQNSLSGSPIWERFEVPDSLWNSKTAIHWNITRKAKAFVKKRSWKITVFSVKTLTEYIRLANGADFWEPRRTPIKRFTTHFASKLNMYQKKSSKSWPWITFEPIIYGTYWEPLKFLASLCDSTRTIQKRLRSWAPTTAGKLF